MSDNLSDAVSPRVRAPCIGRDGQPYRFRDLETLVRCVSDTESRLTAYLGERLDQRPIDGSPEVATALLWALYDGVPVRGTPVEGRLHIWGRLRVGSAATEQCYDVDLRGVTFYHGFQIAPEGQLYRGCGVAVSTEALHPPILAAAELVARGMSLDFAATRLRDLLDRMLER